jgi:hypothetical protein
MLIVSIMVELAVEAVVFVAADVSAWEGTVVLENVLLSLLIQLDVVTVEDVVTAYVIEETVVETVGPSGCLRRPILLPAYSVNQTFTVPTVSL